MRLEKTTSRLKRSYTQYSLISIWSLSQKISRLRQSYVRPWQMYQCMMLHLQRYNIIITQKPRKPIVADTLSRQLRQLSALTTHWVKAWILESTLWSEILQWVTAKWQFEEPLQPKMSRSYGRDRLSYQGCLSQTSVKSCIDQDEISEANGTLLKGGSNCAVLTQSWIAYTQDI